MRGNLNEFQRYSPRHVSRPAADALAKRHSPFQERLVAVGQCAHDVTEHRLFDRSERARVLASQWANLVDGRAGDRVRRTGDVDEAELCCVGPGEPTARSHRGHRGARSEFDWMSAAMPALNGMRMSTSGKQKYPRSSRIARKSCAIASIAPAPNA